jgi:para-nitrobenzyl esterase
MQNAMQPSPTTDTGGSTLRFSVVVDGPTGFLPKSARAIFDAGELNKVSYLLGSNRDEGTLFLLGTTGPTTDAEYQTQLQMRFGPLASQLAAAYPASAFGGDFRKALARAVGDSGLVCGTHDSARRAAAAGLSVFMYNFNVPWAVGGGSLGASHASEISHVFGTPYMADAASQQVSDAMNAYWAQFARTGDPNGPDAPAVWPRFQPDAMDDDQRLQLDASWMVLDNFRKAECAFWRQQYDAAAAH